MTSAEREANPHLIAAAPELFEALQECLRYGSGDTNCDQSCLPPTVRDTARAAIAKATVVRHEKWAKIEDLFGSDPGTHKRLELFQIVS